ncbi:MAG: XRE family transcriptional regulator [Proteobacteria bacterium]|nr:XRE family transcriptional regulator [Pseudomonadota bacterium]
MNWTTLIKTVINRGYTQQQIAELVQCRQPTISALLNGGRGKRISWELGDALLKLEQSTREAPKSSSSGVVSA